MDFLPGYSISISQTTNVVDIEWCAKLMLANEPWISLKRDYDKCIELLQDPLGELYILKDGDIHVGFVIVKLKGAFTGYLQTIAIDESCRGKGVGEAAIGYIEDLIFRSLSNVYLCVSSFNPRARKLYERLGYEEIGILKDLIEKGYDEILMRKTRGPINEFKNLKI